MDPSRICLGYDDDYIYAVSPDGIHSYNIQKGITSVTRNGALNNTDSFVTCFGHQNRLYVGAVNSAGNTKFMSYRVATTPQHQLQIGSETPSFDVISNGLHHINATDVISMIPVYLPTLNSGDNSSSGLILSSDQYQQQQHCAVIASSIPGQFNGLFQMCNHHDNSPQKIPFPDQTATTPLLATNTAHSSIVLLGYPNAKSVHVYSNLNDLSKPDAIYELDIAIPSRGSVQVLDDAATEFLIFDYNRTITHLQLTSNDGEQKNVVGNSFTLGLNTSQRNIGIIELGNHHLFIASDQNDHGYIFEEIPFGVRLSQSIQQRIEETPALSTTTSSPPSLSTAVIGIIIGGSIALIICLLLLGIWLFRRNRRNRQRHMNTQEDEVRSYLTLKEDPEEQPSSPLNNEPTNMERGIDSLANKKLTDNQQHNSSTPPQHYSLRHRDTVITNNDIGNRNTTIRRGIDTIIQRMVSLRSPQSPTSIFSLFSNISSTPPPVTDKYRKVKQVHFPPGASELMEPTFFDSNDTLIVNGHYQLLDDPEVLMTTEEEEENNRIPGYVSRTIQHATKDESIRTLHYYPANQQNAFLRNINITIRLQESRRIICHHDALTLDIPTRSSQYQHYWISGLCMAQQSLHHLLHDQNHPAIVDTRQFNFMSLTVLSLLSCLRDVHALDCCHLGLSLRSFYYQKVSRITEWYVGRFDQAHVIGQPEGYGLMLDVYSAPELVKESVTTPIATVDATATTPCLGHQQQQTTTRHYCYKFSPRPALDCWSLGCAIYEVATGTPLFNDFDQLYQLCCQPSFSQLESHLQQAFDKVDTIHSSFRTCLENLLQVKPIERSSAKMVLDRWITENQLDDDLD